MKVRKVKWFAQGYLNDKAFDSYFNSFYLSIKFLQSFPRDKQ